jgi:phosphoglycerate dehydrogenase-like enzyme
MKVVIPWPVEDLKDEPMPDGVELASWVAGDPTGDLLDAEFVVPPFAASQQNRLARFPNLKVVQAQTAGVDWLLAAVPHGVIVCDAGGVHDIATSEWVVMAIMASVREIPRFVRLQDAHQWGHKHTRELAGRRVLIVGYGSIGAAVERRLNGFEVQITRVARRGRDGVHPLDDLPGLLPEADVAILLVPLTDQTRGMVDVGFLAKLPDGALLVNASRGPVVDAAALVAELATGRITAAVDVTVPEPLPPDDPLWDAPGLLLTPHIGGDTTGLFARQHRFVREQVERYVAGESLVNVVHDGY